MKFVMGAFLGGLIGAAATILLAPGSGEDTRLMIKGRVASLRDEFQAAMREKRAELETELKEYKRLD